MPLRVRFQGGPNAGEIAEFGDEVEVITFGRDADRCQVVFPADNTTVGREHFALKRVLGRYRVLLNRGNPVFVDGKPARDDHELGATADVQVGVKGPLLVLETIGNSTLPPTLDQGLRQSGTGTLVADLETSSRRNRLLAVGVGLLVVVVGVLSWRAFGKTGKDIDDVAKKTAEDLNKTSGKIDDVKSQVAEISERQAQEILKLSESTGRASGNSESSMKKALASTAPSVYLVLTQEKGQSLRPSGTAWVAVDGILATNVHVAEPFLHLGKGGRMIVRSTGEAPRDHEVQEVRLHPGYAAFDGLLKEYGPLRKDLGTLGLGWNGIPACDVALLVVSDPKNLAAPLPLASAEEIAALDAGDLVGAVGYPMEGVVSGGIDPEKPSPTSQIGYVTGATDFFLASCGSDTAQLVHHSIPVAGGASGSPVVNQEGKVVALISAGNFVASGSGGRISAGTGISYAQRVDLLKEVIEKREVASQDKRTAAWRTTLGSFPRRSEIQTYIAKTWAGNEPYEMLNDFSGQAKNPVAGGAFVFKRALKLAKSAKILIVAVDQAEDEAVAAVLVAQRDPALGDELIARGDDGVWVASIQCSIEKGGAYSVYLATRKEGAKIHVYVYGLK